MGYRLRVLIRKEWEEALKNRMVLIGIVILPLFFLGFAVFMLLQAKGLPAEAPPGARFTDLEFFAGKVLAAALPGIVLSWLFFGLFLAVAAALGLLAPEVLQVVLSPTWLIAILILAPLVAVFTVTVSMLISSKVSDTRAAYQLSSFAVLPVVIPIFVYGLKSALLSLRMIVLEAGLVLVLDVLLIILAAKLFRREQILVRWK